MQTFLKRLVRASRWGATLVLVTGCAPHVVGGSGGGGTGGSTGGDTGGSTGGTTTTSTPTTDPTDTSGQALGPTPTPTCVGPVYNDDFGYHGQCCYEEHCIQPDANWQCEAPNVAPITDLPPGSGTCECEMRQGPFLNSDPNDSQKCCYLVGSIGCDGRPLMIEGEARLADVVTGTHAWSALRVGAARTGDAALDEILGRRWSERARYEHASVASFARFSMALLAVGAPPELVMRSQEAGADEVRHAQLALSLASVYAGKPLDLGPLDIDGAFTGATTLEALTLATVVEACVGETLSAVEISASAAVASSPAVRKALSTIAEDETRHAELGWAFVRWAASMGGPRLRLQIALAFEMAFEKAAIAPEVPPSDDIEPAADHGFLPSAEVASLRRAAIRDVLRPAAAELLRDLDASRMPVRRDNEITASV
ncbi:MAG: hypothetical protein U0441_35835 [Polyangiaceae bacterium]